MSRWAEESLTDSRPDVYWNETVGDVPAARVLIGDLSADLVIIGGGFSGLWAAVQAIEDNASRQIVVLEIRTGWLRRQQSKRWLLHPFAHSRCAQRRIPLA